MTRLHAVDAPGDCIEFDDPPQVKQLKEQLSWARSQLAIRETPPDGARMQALESALTQVLEWLDALVEDPDSVAAYDENHAFRGICPSCHQGYRGRPRPELDGLSVFCDRLASQIRETLFGAPEQEKADGPEQRADPQ